MEEKLAYPCPCGGKVEWKKTRIIQEGIDCGILDIERCGKCGEEYLPEESMRIVEHKLKEAGLWGIERKEIKFWKSGKAIVVRFPSELAKKGGLEKAKKGYAYLEGKRKITIEY